MSVRARIQQRRFKDPADEAVVSLLVAAGHVNQRLADLCRGHGVTPDQYNILRILRGVHPGGHPRFEIGNRLINRAPDVTRLIDRLERQRLVERYWAPENRRHSMARITAAGLDLLAAIDPELDEMQQEVLDGLSPDDLRALVRICDHLAR
jgi:DNA-binding MarR family transcriptional regulator